MSFIQNDKDTVKNRQETLKDIDVDLRFQIPKKLLKKVREMGLGKKAREIWHLGNADRRKWLDRQQVFLKDWDEFLESTAEGPFEQSSSLHLPMTFIVTKTFHSRILSALNGDDFRFPVKARREDGAGREDMIGQTMRYTLKEWANFHQGVDSALDDWVWQWCSTGVGIMKWRWDTKYSRYVDVVPSVEIRQQFTTDEDGNEVAQPVPVQIEKEQTVTKEVFNGPVLETVNIEDFMFVGGNGDPEKADVVQHRLYMNSSDLYTLVDQKVFDKEAVDSIIESGPDTMSGGMNNEIKEQRSRNSGMAGIERSSDHDLYEILETYWDVDVDDSGINSQVVTWSHSKSDQVMRATYLQRISPDGKKPFFKADFFKRKDQEYGIGLAEIMHPLTVELDAMHNMRIDFGMLSTMPFGFVRASSSLDPNDIKLSPGSLIPVDNPQTDIVFPNLGNRGAFGANEEANLVQWLERLTGVSNLTLGVQSGQGAARTATGARAIISQANANLDVHLKRISKVWQKAMEYLFHTLQKRIPPGLSFRVTGMDGNDYWEQVRDKGDLIGDFDFEVGTNSAHSDPSVRDQVSQELLGLVSNPLAIQLGVVTPLGFYEAVKNRAQALQVKDFNRYFQQPQGFSVQLSPEEEFNRVINGIDVPVTPEMDHQGYIQYWQSVQGSDEVLGQLDQQQTLRAAQQAQQHEQMLQALQQIESQQANAQQLAVNQGLAQGGAQGGAGVNPLAPASPTEQGAAGEA